MREVSTGDVLKGAFAGCVARLSITPPLTVAWRLVRACQCVKLLPRINVNVGVMPITISNKSSVKLGGKRQAEFLAPISPA